ncbi:MAG: ABC transporter permease, partial [Limnohabitans sp.]
MFWTPCFQGMRLGARQLWRDVRAGELRLLMVSVALAVAALSAVAFLADRLQAGLWRDARQLLGGDAVVVSDRPTPELLSREAQRRGLQTNTNVSFPTMARVPEAEGASRLVALKAVAPGYPLRGQLQVQGAAVAQRIPQPGEVWVDPPLLDALGLQSGQMLGLGERPDEVVWVRRDLRAHGVEMLTLGQYLRPSPAHLPVAEFVEPSVFA